MDRQATEAHEAKQLAMKQQMDKALGLTQSSSAEDEDDEEEEELLQLDGLQRLLNMGEKKKEPMLVVSEQDKMAHAQSAAHDALDRTSPEPLDAGWQQIGDMDRQATEAHEAKQLAMKQQMDKALGLTQSSSAEDEDEEE